MLLQKVRSILKKDCGFQAKSKFLVGVSGGPDSVCLLDILSHLPYEIIVGHLNHNLRPSSGEEMDFVKNIASSYGCKFIGKSVNILKLSGKNKTGIEEISRKERYQFLFTSAQTEEANAVLVAHQADDQIETILMNLIRGTGLSGMSGMRMKSLNEFNSQIPLIRPFLMVWREEIMDYCCSHKLAFKLDESNQSLIYTRTSIRNHLLPEMEKLNPNIKRALLRTQQVFEEDYRFLQESISQAFKDIQLNFQDEMVFLKVAGFKKLPMSLQRLVIKEILEKYFFDQEAISFTNIESARKMFSRETRRLSLKINDRLFAFIDMETGILSRENTIGQERSWPRIKKELVISTRPGLYPVGSDWQLEIQEISPDQIGEKYQKNQNTFIAYIDKNSTNDSLFIRPWIRGDRFQPLGMKGKSIKLSDFWINRKVQPHARIDWPLIISQNEIIWLPGFLQSHKTRITKDTRKILILKLSKNL